MKTKKENRHMQEFSEDRLPLVTMLLLHGGDGGEENPGEPIVKGP